LKSTLIIFSLWLGILKLGIIFGTWIFYIILFIEILFLISQTLFDYNCLNWLSFLLLGSQTTIKIQILSLISCSYLLEYDNHLIHPDWRMILDHTSLTINISIFKKHIQTKKQFLVKNSEEENQFTEELTSFNKGFKIDNIQSKETL